jgi:hypothetical protein
MPSIDFKLTGIVIAILIILIGGGMGLNRYMKRRKWDELK